MFLTYILFIALLNFCNVYGKIPNFYESLTPSFNLEKNASLEKVVKYYETLFLRLHSKHYGFSSFGDTCEIATPQDYEDHLDMGYGILRDQEEDGKYRRAVEEHLYPLLRSFFYRSKLLCDFRRLLHCDKSTLRCKCVHSSMGIGRDEHCQVNVGKPCDLNQGHLSSLGIPILDKEPLINITCIGGHSSECVASFGKATKLCRCKPGYFGSRCNPSLQHSWAHPSKPEDIWLKRKRQQGKVILKKNGTIEWREFWEGEEEEEEFYLDPDIIKKELVKLMNLRQIYEPQEREKEAEELYLKMESDSDKEEMVMRDIFIRRLANIHYGQDCSADKQIIIDNPPLAQEGGVWVDPKPQDVKLWQLSLLQDEKPFCNFVRFLKCSEAEDNKCVCREGLVYDKNTGNCKIRMGFPCGTDFESLFEFDPLKDKKRFTSPYSPVCVTGAKCQNKGLFFLKHCWCPEDAITCGGGEKKEKILHPPQTLVTEIDKRFSLNLRQSCDPESQAKLLNPIESEIKDYSARILSLKKILSHKPQIHFCNLNKFLNCSELTKKCECFHPLVQDNVTATCRVKNWNPCQDNFPYGLEFYKGGAQMWKIEQVFNKKFSPQCIRYAKCGLGDNIVGKCACTNGNSGSLCDDLKSVFASVLNPSNIHDYNTDSEINLLFDGLNILTYKMEELMTLGYNEKCDSSVAYKLQRIMDFYRKIANSKELMTRETFYQYEKASMWIKLLLQSGVTELCNKFLGFTCHKTCQCPSGFIYQDKICKLNATQECDPNPMASWVPRCRNNSQCLVTLSSPPKFICQCDLNWRGDFSCMSPSSNKIIGDDQDCETFVIININGTTFKECTYQDALELEMDDIEQSLTDVDEKYSVASEMLNEMLNLRNVSLEHDCDFESDIIMMKLFPNILDFNPSTFESLPSGKMLSFSELRKIYNSKAKICDKRMNLVCNKETGKCDCDPKIFVREGENCRLREGKFCGKIGHYFDKNLPLAKCKMGTNCKRGRHGYGAYVCVNEDNDLM